MELGSTDQQAFIHQDKRKIAIKAALLRLKQKNEGYLDSLQRNIKWRKIYNGLLFNGAQSELNKLVKLQLCSAAEGDRSYFNPFEKIPITMCYNKFNKQEMFQEQALYNVMKVVFQLVLLYDSKIKRDVNWNNVDMTARSTIRALHIANICKREDRQCFQREVEKRVLDKDRFKGREFSFEDAYRVAIEDMTPISQITYG